MILTFTPNPSVDTTFSIPGELERGFVHRLQTIEQVAGGKGINVSHALAKAQASTLAVFPAANDDQFLTLMHNAQIPAESVPIKGAVRINTAITEPDGTTTKFNGLGPVLSEREITRLTEVLVQQAAEASWVVFAGSLPQGVPEDWYCQLRNTLARHYPDLPVAIDTSDGPLRQIAAQLDSITPTLIKPNGFELGQFLEIDGRYLEAQARIGNYDPVVAAASKLVDRGVRYVLVTLGDAGAVLVSAEQAFLATPPPTTVVSTVGAGDCALAGFLLAQSKGLGLGQSLQLSVAYGSAAASLPGTSIPDPHMLRIEETTVQTFTALSTI